jgi:hypothetical protein
LKILSIILIFFTLSSNAEESGILAQTKTAEDDRAKIQEYSRYCRDISSYLVRDEFQVECNSNYQHYGPTKKSLKPLGRSLRIAGYNLLHPGTSKALFKDYSLLAKIMNKFDIVSGLEILGTVGHDRANNENVLKLIHSAPALIANLVALKQRTRAPKQLKEIDAKIMKLTVDSNNASSLFRGPGYYKILMALKKIDPSWALILSPRGDSAIQGSVEEMVGFFYRANAVTPVMNPHCKEFKDLNGGVPYACIINVDSGFMGKNFTHSYSRRPFMGSFKSGSLKFSIVSMHVVFNFSGDEVAEKKLMNDVFNVDSASVLGTGINSSNFARFAEVKITLDFMDKFRNKYNEDNIMLVSDTNISGSNAFWPEVLKSFPGGSLLINQPTTISPVRYSGDGKETNGVASSYDHFVLDKSAFPSCDDGQVYNYYNSDIQADIENAYLVRDTNRASPLNYFPVNSFKAGSITDPDDQTILDGDIPADEDPIPTKFDYQLSSLGKLKMDKLLNDYALKLSSLYTVKNNEIVSDDFQLNERIDGFGRRVLTNQLTNAFYYRFYQEILSDHFPVSISCKY